MQIPKPLGVEVVKGYPHMYKTIIEEKPPWSDLLSIVLFINLQDDRFKVVTENWILVEYVDAYFILR